MAGRAHSSATCSWSTRRPLSVGDDLRVDAPIASDAYPDVPRIPASAGALIFDEGGGC